MKTALLFAMQVIALFTFAQDCHRAYWVDAYDGTQANESFIDIDRHPDGGFVVCGRHGSDGTTLGGASVNTGSNGYYLARMDSAGNVSNLVSLFSQNGIDLKRIIVLSDGSVAAGCTVNANITLGSETFHMHGGAKPLIIKFNSSFQYQWHRAAQNTSNAATVRDISRDSQDNLYWGGTFSGDDLWFGGEFHLHRVTDGPAWFSKISSTGEMLWLHSLGGGNSAGLQTVTVDSNDDVWITGQATLNANGQLKFSDEIIAPGYLNSAFCLYAAKYDPSGTCLWGKITSSTSSFGSIYSADAMADTDGNMYICGNMSGVYNWANLAMNGGDGSGYLLSLDSNGNGRWFKSMGGQGASEFATALDVRGDRISVVGTLSSNQPYVGNFPVYSLATGTYKAFNAQFYTNGELEFCRMNQNDTQNFLQFDVTIDEGMNQLVFGYFKGTNVQWYPFSLTHTGTNPKMFVAKFGPSSPTAFTISAGPDKITTCGTNVQLNGSTTPTNGVGFGWWPDMGFSGNYSKTPAANTGSPTDYIFYGFYQGCVKRDTVHVDLSNHNLTIQANASDGICLGDTLDLTAVCSDPSATIAWTPNYRLTSATALSTSTFTNTSLNYVVEATVNGCKARDTVSVAVHRKPSIVLPYQQFYQTYQMHTCIGDPIEADLGLSDNTYTIDPPANITWQNDHSVVFGTDQQYYGGIISATSPEGCTNQLTFTVYAYEQQTGPPIINQPNDTIYLCPASGYVYEEEFMITTDIFYLPEEFNFSWYSGWQVDSLDGLGWRDIEYHNYGHFELFPNSVGNPTSAYYVPLRFWNVEPEMDGFKFRAYINDLCSNRSYTDEMVLRVGPAFTDQTTSLILCEGATDTLFVEAANSNGDFQWQVFRNAVWTDLLSNEDNILIDNNHLILLNAAAGMDSLFRCRIDGCSPEIFAYSTPISIEVQTNNIQFSGPFQSTACLGENLELSINATGGSFEYSWFRDGQLLIQSTPGHLGTNNDTLVIQTALFNPQGHTYTCQLYNAQCGQNFSTGALTVEVLIPPTIEWALADTAFCVDEGPQSIALASPAGGSYFGSILNDNIIYPAIHTPGTYGIVYSFEDEQGCTTTAQRTIILHALPEVNLELFADRVCINSDTTAIDYTATPLGSDISGDGFVIDHENNQAAIPSVPGVYAMHLTFTDAYGCFAETTASFEVLDTIGIDWVNELGTFCMDQETATISLPSPEGGNYSPYEVSSEGLHIAAIAAGTHTLNYQYTHTNGCISNRSAAFGIQDIQVIWTDSLIAGCATGDPIPLGNPQPVGGLFSGIGVVDNHLNPVIAGVGFHPVTYTYIDSKTGCDAQSTQYVQVYEQPTLNWALSDADFCPGDGNVLLEGGTPSGGTYSGSGVIENNPGQFALETDNLAAGAYMIDYHYTDNSGCSNSVSTAITIHDAPAIAWASDLGSFCTNAQTVAVAQPDPAGGVFSPATATWGQLEIGGLEPGPYSVSYTYTDAFGCIGEASAVYAVNDTVPLVWMAPFPGEPNNGFYFCGNYTFDYQADLTNYATPQGGTFNYLGNNLENNTWTWGEFFEIGLYPITYTFTDTETGCTSSSLQTFELDLCGAVDQEQAIATTCWSDGGERLWFNSPTAGHYTLMNLAGQVVSKGSLRGGVQAASISVAAGIYVVRINSGDQITETKLLIGY